MCSNVCMNMQAEYPCQAKSHNIDDKAFQTNLSATTEIVSSFETDKLWKHRMCD